MCRRRPPGRGSSICEPTAIAHQAADERQPDLDIETKAGVLACFRRLDARAKKPRQLHAETPHAAHRQIEPAIGNGQLQVESERAEFFDHSAAWLPQADILTR